MPAPSAKRSRPGSAPTKSKGRQQAQQQRTAPAAAPAGKARDPKTRGERGIVGPSRPKKQRAPPPEDEDIASDFSSDDDEEHEESSASDEDEAESADQKRLRLAKQYLAAVGSGAAGEADDEDEVDAAIENRLTKDVLVAKNRYTKMITKGLFTGFTGAMTGDSTRRRLRGHSLSATCVALGKDDMHAFSGSKDCSVIQWDVETGKKLSVMVADKAKKGRDGQVLCVAASSDGRLVASGGRDKLVRLWDARSNELLGSFSGHRDIVTALTFQDGTSQLYTGSADRTVKLWNMTEQAYLDTLYGHQSPILALDSLSRERCLSSGADRALRLWKIPEDSQLVFNGHSSGNIDTVSMINEELFVSGGEDGEVCLWSAAKKKPVASAPHSVNRIAEEDHECCHWVSAVAGCRYSNLAASGAADGVVRLWRADKSLTPVGTVPIEGHVNGLALTADGSVLVAATGQEHRMGRWSKIQKAKNAVHVVRIGSGEADGSDEDEDVESDYEDDSLDEDEAKEAGLGDDEEDEEGEDSEEMGEDDESDD